MRCERREKHGDPNNMTIPGWRSADVLFPSLSHSGKLKCRSKPCRRKRNDRVRKGSEFTRIRNTRLYYYSELRNLLLTHRSNHRIG